MRKLKVTGPSIMEIMEIFKNSIVHGDSAKIELYEGKTSTTFEVIIDIIDARIWHFPSSVFNDDETLKKTLIIKGWLNREKREKFDSTVTKYCTVEIFVTGEIYLKIR
jgi:uncharacterized OsmC-like protein